MYLYINCFFCSSLSVQLTLGHGIRCCCNDHLTFLFTMVGAMGQSYSTIAFKYLVVALYTTLTYTKCFLVYQCPILILCGFVTLLVYALFFVHLMFQNRPVQKI